MPSSYQTIFPSVFYQRCFNALARIDRCTGRLLTQLVRWFEKKILRRLGRHAQTSLRSAGFCSFVKEAVYLLFPHVDELWETGFADALKPKARRKLMCFYRSCLQRQLYVNGPDKTVLSKATQSCGSVESLLETFPDAKFITIIRHPYQSVPSHVSVFYPVWRAHSPEIAKDGPVSKSYARLALKWYQHLFEFRSKVSPCQYHCLDYRDLTQNRQASVEKLYEHFGWTMSDVFRARLAVAVDGEREFESKHRYTLEEFGLSKEWIQEELGPLLDHYSLAR